MRTLPLITILLSTLLTVPSFAKGKMGAGSSGGGDSYVLDFVKTATQEVYPWLLKNGRALDSKININDFLVAINPKEIVSIAHVFESCDGSNTGREVEACYNADTDFIYLSRTMYRVNDNSPAKQGVVAHELFRKMGAEGDNYEITKQMVLEKTPVENISSEQISITYSKELKANYPNTRIVRMAIDGRPGLTWHLMCKGDGVAIFFHLFLGNMLFMDSKDTGKSCDKIADEILQASSKRPVTLQTIGTYVISVN